MLTPVAVLLGLDLLASFVPVAELAKPIAARFIAWDGPATFDHVPSAVTVATQPPAHPFIPWLTLALAVALAALDLGHHRLPRWLRSQSRRVTGTGPLAVLDRLHDGVIGDYVAWLVAGLAILALSCAALVT